MPFLWRELIIGSNSYWKNNENNTLKDMHNNNTKDVIWLDWAKVIGIFLVVFGHVLQRIPGWEEGCVRRIWDWIYLFHMPLFFVISGYLFKQGIKNFRKIFWALVVPYFLYQFLCFPLWNWKSIGSEETILSFIGKHIMGILLGDGYKTPISFYSCLPCWFIVSIIQLKLIFSYIRINKLTSTLLIIVSVIFLYVQKSYAFDLYGCFDSTIMAIPYFLIGYWLKESEIGDKLINTLIGGGGKLFDILYYNYIDIDLQWSYSNEWTISREKCDYRLCFRHIRYIHNF